ncbi:MAG: HEPN domain-containing protein [Phycisphaerae bacterium]
MALAPNVADWISKAEGDVAAARILLERFDAPLAHTIAFHAQQAVEKYLKTVLVQDRVVFPRTHDLVELVSLLAPQRPPIAALKLVVVPLQPYAVNARYPGYDPDRSLCEDAVRRMLQVRAACRAELGLPPEA